MLTNTHLLLQKCQYVWLWDDTLNTEHVTYMYWPTFLKSPNFEIWNSSEPKSFWKDFWTCISTFSPQLSEVLISCYYFLRELFSHILLPRNTVKKGLSLFGIESLDEFFKKMISSFSWSILSYQGVGQLSILKSLK